MTFVSLDARAAAAVHYEVSVRVIESSIQLLGVALLFALRVGAFVDVLHAEARCHLARTFVLRPTVLPESLDALLNFALSVLLGVLGRVT
jgi:hypothetical protein